MTYSSLDFIDSLNFCKFVEKFEIAGHIVDSEQGPSVDLTQSQKCQHSEKALTKCFT